MGPIGVFDSGYGGLTVFKEIVRKLPQYEYIYFGDNARAPYGSRSFETIYKYTLECVEHLFRMDCRLVILACNTASAKALRSIQQQNLSAWSPDHRVLGVIRPTAEVAGSLTSTGHLGIFATEGTVKSQSYILEIDKLFPDIQVWQQACPMWVPLIENNELDNPGAAYFVERYVQQLLMQQPDIDAILLGCTHYPLLYPLIRRHVPAHIQLIAQGELVADSLADYLLRHPDKEAQCRKGAARTFYTTETPAVFDEKAALFFGEPVQSRHFEHD